MAQLVVRQYDVFRVSDGRRPSDAPFVVVLQSHYVELERYVVAPLLDTPERFDVAKLTVRVTVEGRSYALYVAELATAPRSVLRTRVANLSEHEDAIRRAMERLFSGF